MGTSRIRRHSPATCRGAILIALIVVAALSFGLPAASQTRVVQTPPSPAGAFSRYARPVPASFFADLPFSMAVPVPPSFPDRTFSIVDFGAVPDGITLNTRAFAAAIAACARAGGGHVIVPRGVWVTGPIVLGSHVDLHLETGALVSFSRRFEDFLPVVERFEGSGVYRVHSAITAHHAVDIAITGGGVFDGSGEAWRYVKKEKMTPPEWERLVASGGAVNDKGTEWWPSKAALEGAALVARLQKQRPAAAPADYAAAREDLRADMVNITHSRNVQLDGPTFRNSPQFAIHPVECENLIIRDIQVRNPWNSQNGDGIDLGSSHNVIVYDTIVDVGDDGICLKPGKIVGHPDWKAACENIVIADSTVFRAHGGFVVGSETYGGTRNIAVRNVTFVETDIGLRFKSAPGRGGVTERIFIRDVAMKNIATAAVLFETSYSGNAPGEGAAGQDARLAATIAEEAKTGAEGKLPQFQDIFVENVVCDGARQAMSVRGLAGGPVRNIHFKNVTLVADQGASLSETEGFTFSNVQVRAAQGPAYILEKTRNLTLEKSVISPGTGTFVSVTDAATVGIRIVGTDLRGIPRPVALAPGADPKAVEVK
jgi:polygalacturonase